MRNELQEAIEYFETYSKEYKPVSNSVPKYILDDLNEQTQLYRTALTALLDALKRAEGCEYCAVNDWERKSLAEWTTYFDNWVEEKHELYISDYNGEYFISPDATEGPRFDIQYCPMCGRKLTAPPRTGAIVPDAGEMGPNGDEGVRE